MAFAYEKEAVGEVRRAVSMNSPAFACRSARARAAASIAALSRWVSLPAAFVVLAARRARSTVAAARRALLEQSTSQVPALDDNGNLVVKSGMSNAH